MARSRRLNAGRLPLVRVVAYQTKAVRDHDPKARMESRRGCVAGPCRRVVSLRRVEESTLCQGLARQNTEDSRVIHRHWLTTDNRAILQGVVSTIRRSNSQSLVPICRSPEEP